MPKKDMRLSGAFFKHPATRLIGACPLVLAALMFAGGPTFHPDATVQGSSLTGWHTLGNADWRMQNGEIVGTPRSPAGGWLILDKSYQDVGVFASFQCLTGCLTGVLMRAEKTPDGGMKGVFVSLTDADRTPDEPPVPLTEQQKTGLASYALVVDANGKIIKHERLRRGGGQMRIAPALDPNAPGPGGRRTRRRWAWTRSRPATAHPPSRNRPPCGRMESGRDSARRQHRARFPEYLRQRDRRRSG